LGIYSRDLGPEALNQHRCSFASIDRQSTDTSPDRQSRINNDSEINDQESSMGPSRPLRLHLFHARLSAIIRSRIGAMSAAGTPPLRCARRPSS
jgi:hypothetical protein